MEKKAYRRGLKPADGEERVIPVMREELEVRKRTVDTGKTRITKKIHEREEAVDVPLLKQEVQVERVPVNRFVEEPLPVRHVGDTIIVPLLEEVLVVEKRLLLKEELHIRKQVKEVRKPQTVTLRSEEAFVEHTAEHEDTEVRKR